MNYLTYLEIDIEQLNKNIKHILSYKTGDFMFVIKGNAYGHGYIEIVKELNEYKEIKYIGVSSCIEARIVKPYTDKSIVILGYTEVSCFNDLLGTNVIPTITSVDDLIRIQNQKIFINIDTGFHRLGIKPLPLNIEKIRQHSNIEGIFTHLKLTNEESDLSQITQFEKAVKDLDIPFKSISDSIAYTRYNTNENLYRIGALMFGLTSPKEEDKINVLPISKLVSTITRIEKIEKDTSAFYRSTIKKETVIATIQIGYGDGLFRDMKDSNVLVNNHKCNYIEVGMDQSIIDITGVPCEILDSVTIFGGNGISLEELSKSLSTNKNNIITCIHSRVTRKYKRKDSINYLNHYEV